MKKLILIISLFIITVANYADAEGIIKWWQLRGWKSECDLWSCIWSKGTVKVGWAINMEKAYDPKYREKAWYYEDTVFGRFGPYLSPLYFSYHGKITTIEGLPFAFDEIKAAEKRTGKILSKTISRTKRIMNVIGISPEFTEIKSATDYGKLSEFKKEMQISQSQSISESLRKNKTVEYILKVAEILRYEINSNDNFRSYLFFNNPEETRKEPTFSFLLHKPENLNLNDILSIVDALIDAFNSGRLDEFISVIKLSENPEDALSFLENLMKKGKLDSLADLYILSLASNFAETKSLILSNAFAMRRVIEAIEKNEKIAGMDIMSPIRYEGKTLREIDNETLRTLIFGHLKKERVFKNDFLNIMAFAKDYELLKKEYELALKNNDPVLDKKIKLSSSESSSVMLSVIVIVAFFLLVSIFFLVARLKKK